MKTMRIIFAATLVALLSSVGAYAQAISSLPAASTVGATDVFVGVQSGTTKKFPFSVIEAGISVSGVEDGDKGDITVASSGLAWSIDAGAITEAMLKCVNAPTDEYMLTYEATTGDYEWQAPFSAANVPAAETDSAHDTAAEVGAVALQGSTPGTAQTGNSNVSGTAVVGTAVVSPSVVGGSSGSSALSLDGDSSVSGAASVSADGRFTLGIAGTQALPALRFPGGGGIFDDSATGGVAITFNPATAASWMSGAVYKMLVDTNRLQLATGHHLGWGVVGGSSDVGLVRNAAGILGVTDGGSGTGAIGKVSSVTGGTSGSSTLVLDGDSTVTGNTTIDGAGKYTPTGGIDLRTSQATTLNVILRAGSHGTGYFYLGNAFITGYDSPVVVDGNASLQIMGTGGVLFEGTTDDTAETKLTVTDPTADRTITLPNATGTVGTFVAAPAAATDACVAGQYAAATGFAYFCVSANTWERVPIATW